MPKCPHCAKDITCSVTFITNAPPSQASPAPPVDSSEIGDLIERIDFDALDPAAQKFVTDTNDRLEKYGARILLSTKQVDWLRKLAGT